MSEPLTVASLITHLQRFPSNMPCVCHIWLADDLADIESELTPEEILATLALADSTLDADISLSWHFLRHCAETVIARREKSHGEE